MVFRLSTYAHNVCFYELEYICVSYVYVYRWYTHDTDDTHIMKNLYVIFVKSIYVCCILGLYWFEWEMHMLSMTKQLLNYFDIDTTNKQLYLHKHVTYILTDGRTTSQTKKVSFSDINCRNFPKE